MKKYRYQMRNNLISLTLALFILIFGTQAFADFKDGWEAYKNGDYATALKEWRPLAEKGDGLAQFSLGHLYETARGATQDYKAAIKWYKLAAEQGDASAQGSLAFMYASGDGVIQDFVLAHMWLSISESNGRESEELYIDKVETMMTGDQIVIAKKLARECVAKNYKDC